jgi:hypothetical protein
MKDLKTLLDQGFDDAENAKKVKEMYKKIWKKDIRAIASMLTEYIDDPESLLKKLAYHVQMAREEGFSQRSFSLGEYQ